MAGDVLDPAAVASAVHGCDAVLHVANVYTLDSQRADEMYRVNVDGTAHVLDAAVAAGCRHIVHVSSMVTLLPSDGPIPADPPIGRGTLPYARSKIGAERVARRHQEHGAAVSIVYPAQVFGPDDPGAGEMVGILRGMLADRMPVALGGEFGIVDVRWLAHLLTEVVITPDPGGQRIVAPGTVVAYRQILRTAYRLTGRRRPLVVPLPARAAVHVARAVQWVAQRTGRHLDIEPEGPWVLANWQSADDHLARQIGGPMPSFDETLADSIRWMSKAGHLTSEQAGVLAARP